MPVMKQLRIGSVNYDTVGSASVTQTLTSGTEIATVTIDGTSTKLYAPAGGGGGSTVTVTPILTSGTQTATISVDGTDTTLYAPTPPTVPSASSTAPSMDGTAAAGASADYARADHVHPTDTSRQAALVSGTNIKTINSQSLLGSGNLAIQELPTVSASDNGKVLGVVNGAWAKTSSGGGGGSSWTDISAAFVAENPSIEMSDCVFMTDGTFVYASGNANADGSGGLIDIACPSGYEPSSGATTYAGTAFSTDDLTATPCVADSGNYVIEINGASDGYYFSVMYPVAQS